MSKPEKKKERKEVYPIEIKFDFSPHEAAAAAPGASIMITISFFFADNQI